MVSLPVSTRRLAAAAERDADELARGAHRTNQRTEHLVPQAAVVHDVADEIAVELREPPQHGAVVVRHWASPP